MARITFGRQITGDLAAAASREWLLTDGLGGFAMGTVGGLRTRRYHGLLVNATEPPIGRRIALAALDAVVVIGDRRVELATHEWASGAVSPAGHRLLDWFELVDGVPVWQWSQGALTIRLELAMVHGRNAIGASWQLVSAPTDTVRLEIGALCTWRDVHAERGAGEVTIDTTTDGFVFEHSLRVAGPGFGASGVWYHGVHHRDERARGLASDEDLCLAGVFANELRPGESVELRAWTAPLDDPPAPAGAIITAARARARRVAAAAGATDDVEALLAHAADQMIVAGAGGPTVVAGYPWFGDWSRDTMTSYEGLFLDTGRVDEGAALLRSAAATVSEGMLANTADAGGTEYNTVDATPWFMHVIGRHVERTGDLELGLELLPVVDAIVESHQAGTRFGIRLDGDGLLTHGAEGWALTWMDARVDGRPITQRAGKPVEVNALWIAGLTAASRLAIQLGRDASRFERRLIAATTAFAARFPHREGLYDVVDGCAGDDRTLRPNQVIAAGLTTTPLDSAQRRRVLSATEPLRTSIGLRSLAPTDPAYAGHHRGGPAERDGAYHQGTVWPWLLGPYVDALLATGDVATAVAAMRGAEPHLFEWGLGSVCETADGDPPHGATGCPFQAWSVAEWLRVRRRVARHT